MSGRVRAVVALLAGLVLAVLAWLSVAINKTPLRPRPGVPPPPRVVRHGRRSAAGGTRALVPWPIIALLAVLGVGGIAGVVLLALGGPEPRAKWGYLAATLAFLLSTALAAPTFAFATRLARGHWAAPLRRLAELFALAGLVAAPAYLLLLAQLPSWRGRPSIWLDWPGAPGVWDGLALVLLAVGALVFLYVGARPDFGGRLSVGWRGAPRQWRVLGAGLVAVGGFYTMLFVFANLLVVSDFAMSLVPDWKSANMPPYHAVSGFAGGVGATVLAAAAARRFGGQRDHIRADSFHAAGKILIALALLYFYFSWAEFLTYWYGRTEPEKKLLQLLMFGPAFVPFVAALVLNFLLPFLLLLWNGLRASVTGVTLAAASIVLGTLVDRVRIYVAAWSVAGPVGRGLEVMPPFRAPGLLDVLVVVGLPAAALCLYGLALRLVPAVAPWELRTRELFSVEPRFMKTTVPVVAKPS